MAKPDRIGRGRDPAGFNPASGRPRRPASHRDRIANTARDSVLAEFSSAVDAVQRAVAAQGALAEANAGASPDRHINFRIGVHVGDVMVKGGDLFGDGVNTTARLQTLATPGGVSVSGAVYDHVRKVLPFAFVDLRATAARCTCFARFSIKTIPLNGGTFARLQPSIEAPPGSGMLLTWGDACQQLTNFSEILLVRSAR